VTIKKFETNPVLVNENKLKPYKYTKSEVQKQEQQCQYIGNRVKVEVRWKILVHRKKMKVEIQKPDM
jgi:hypothetical protein